MELRAYNVRLKEKDRLMTKAVVNFKNNRFICLGLDALSLKKGEEHKMSLITNRENAYAAIEAGNAEVGEGWTKEMIKEAKSAK